MDKDQEGEGSLYEGTDDNRFVFFSLPDPWTTKTISRGKLITYPTGSGSITLVFLQIREYCFGHLEVLQESRYSLFIIFYSCALLPTVAMKFGRILKLGAVQ